MSQLNLVAESRLTERPSLSTPSSSPPIRALVVQRVQYLEEFVRDLLLPKRVPAIPELYRAFLMVERLRRMLQRNANSLLRTSLGCRRDAT